jgi:hypothetical protein
MKDLKRRKVIIDYDGVRTNIVPLRLEYGLADDPDTWTLLAYNLDRQEFTAYDMNLVNNWRKA